MVTFHHSAKASIPLPVLTSSGAAPRRAPAEAATFALTSADSFRAHLPR